jgi:hypothetical protein
MQVDKVPLPVNILEKREPVVLIHQEQADITIGMNMIIGEPLKILKSKKILGDKVVLEKDVDGKNKLKATIRIDLRSLILFNSMSLPF